MIGAEVREAYKFTSKKGATKIIAKLNSQEDKQLVMRNKQQLSTITGKPIYISSDLIKKDEYAQFKGREFAKQMKENGKLVKIGYKKVIVDNTEYKWDAGTETYINEKN